MIKAEVFSANGKLLSLADIFQDQQSAEVWFKEQSKLGSWDEFPGYTVIYSNIEDPLVIIKARELLSSTDWYIIREMDSGVVAPEDIKAQRAAARLIINPK